MDENDLLEIATMCREASSIVPTNKAEDEANAGKMFAQLHAIAVVCMDGNGLSPELRKVIPFSKQGELHIAVSAINQTRIFSNDKAPVVKSQLARIGAILTEAALRLNGNSISQSSHTPLFKPTSTNMDVFISHSSKDSDIAEALIDLIQAAVRISPSKIRCTSVDGYRLPGGASTDEQLKREVRESSYFIGLLTPISVKSSYVLFELGARWGAQLHFVPLLSRGAEAKDLPGPVSGINALRSDSGSQLHQLVQEISEKLGRPLERASTYEKQLQNLILASRSNAESSAELVQNVSEQQQSQATDFTAPTTQSGKELLEFIRNSENADARGLLEVFDTLSPGQITVFPNTVGSGNVVLIKPRLFREGVNELIEKGWLYPPEDDGKTRTYEYRGQE